MLLAGSSLYSDINGFRRYDPNMNVEQLAIYDRNIAYRYTYKTNNQGLVSYPNLHKNDALDLVINGDSFTEGQGGFPWVLEWQKNELKNSNILSLNYSIAGNGFVDFLKGSIHSKNKYGASKNIIFFIEHDAYRPYQKMSRNKNCSYYSNGFLDIVLGSLTCKTYGIVWHHIDPNKSDLQILNEAKYLQQYGVLPSMNKFLKTLKNSSSLKKIEQNDKETESITKNVSLRFGPIPTYTKYAIEEINKLYGNNKVLLVQLPERIGLPDKRELEFTKK